MVSSKPPGTPPTISVPLQKINSCLGTSQMAAGPTRPQRFFLRLLSPPTMYKPLLAVNLPSLQARREELSNSFFREICNPNSCLNYLLPPKRDTSVTSRLRAATPCPRTTLRTKKYCSFINYGLSHYQ